MAEMTSCQTEVVAWVQQQAHWIRIKSSLTPFYPLFTLFTFLLPFYLKSQKPKSLAPQAYAILSKVPT
jgi:hypothetical protein